MITSWIKRLLPFQGSAPDQLTVLHFHIGPVQSFIHQSRRTRDLWAGSFLLSWLSGTVMAELAEITENTATPHKILTFPCLVASTDNPSCKEGVILDDMYRDIIGEGSRNSWRPTLPNHFRALLEADHNVDPAQLTKNVESRWYALAEAVWNVFLEPLPNDTLKERARSVWDRQVGTQDAPSSFWQVYWAMGTRPEDGFDVNWLDMRKSARWTSALSAEPGRQCMLIPGLQEASGVENSRARQDQDAFWKALRARIAEVRYGNASLGILDLREGEMLSPIALIRRLFPILPAKTLKAVIGWVPGGESQHVQETTTVQRSIAFWPSTSMVAAAPWLQHACEIAPETVKRLANATTQDKIGPALAHAEAAAALEVPRLNQLPSEAGDIAQRDGTLFYEEDLMQIPVSTIRGGQDAIQSATTALKTLTKKMGAGPSNYYAILAMDGDRIGEHMRVNPEDISQRLSIYSQSVGSAFRDLNATLIYSGGDDLLAMCAIDDVLQCAQTARAIWQEAFKGCEQEATLSAGIALVHRRTNLRWAIEFANETLLNQWSKDTTGRDAVTFGLLRSGGGDVLWSTPWQRTTNGAHGASVATALQSLSEYLTSPAASAGIRADQGALYKLASGLTPWMLNNMDEAREFWTQNDTNLKLTSKVSDQELACIALYWQGRRSNLGEDDIKSANAIIALMRAKANGKNVAWEELPLQPGFLRLLNTLNSEMQHKALTAEAHADA